MNLIIQLLSRLSNETLDHYRTLLRAQQEHRLQLPNDNLDTGAVTGAATYRLADETYAKLVHKTSGKTVSDPLRRNLLSYYADLEKPFATKRNSKAWHELIKELDTLKSTPAVGISLSTDSSNSSVYFIGKMKPYGPLLEESRAAIANLTAKGILGSLNA
jgi:hypothetical protein